MLGKIITIIGAPGSGKSFLARKLAPRLNAQLFLEGEVEDFPKEVLDKLGDYYCDLKLFIWFTNKLIKEMKEAQKLKETGKTVILDTFWMIDECYLEFVREDTERKEAMKILEENKKNLQLPDKIIMLKASEDKIVKQMKKRDRSFENEEIVKKNLFLAKEYERIFTKKKFGDRLIIIDREKLDFEKEEDLKEIIEKI
ncbi:MAG: deoxynucleoside kinase [Candidatus Woesearchaeota archaeon]|jgi:deoxyadenosine/deoxycytidine kinase